MSSHLAEKAVFLSYKEQFVNVYDEIFVIIFYSLDIINRCFLFKTAFRRLDSVLRQKGEFMGQIDRTGPYFEVKIKDEGDCPKLNNSINTQ
jgi:hypothetical protein